MTSLDGDITRKEQKKDHGKIVEASIQYPKETIHGKLMSSQYETEQEINSVRHLWKKTTNVNKGNTE